MKSIRYGSCRGDEKKHTDQRSGAAEGQTNVCMLSSLICICWCRETEDDGIGVSLLSCSACLRRSCRGKEDGSSGVLLLLSVVYLCSIRDKDEDCCGMLLLISGKSLFFFRKKEDDCLGMLLLYLVSICLHSCSGGNISRVVQCALSYDL